MPIIDHYIDSVHLDDPKAESERASRVAKRMFEQSKDKTANENLSGSYTTPGGFLVKRGDPCWNPAGTLTLGIDQSITSTGYVLLSSESISPIEHGCIQTNPDDFPEIECTPVRKVSRMRYIVDTLIEELKDKNRWPYIGNIAFEGLAFAGKGDASRDLAGLQAIFIDSFIKAGIHPNNISIYAPNTVKMIAGHGQFKKPQMFDALPDDIRELFERSYLKSKGRGDVVDAFWIATTDKQQPRTKLFTNLDQPYYIKDVINQY